MKRLLKYIAYVFLAVVVLVVAAGLAVKFLFDPNDLKGEVESRVKEATGRDLIIEGDIGLNVFPWLELDVGRTELGNAPGFGDEPMASFERVVLSVKLLPMLLRRDVIVRKAEFDTLYLNYTIENDLRTNWDDLLAAGEAGTDSADETGSTPVKLDISSVEVRNSSFVLQNKLSGDSYTITNANLSTGRLAAGEALPMKGGLSFDMQPLGMRGDIEMELEAEFVSDSGEINVRDADLAGTIEGVTDVPVQAGMRADAISVNTVEGTIDAGEVRMTFLDVIATLDVERFSYSDKIHPAAKISIAEFSPRKLMQQLKIEPPVTADPKAFGKLAATAELKVTDDAVLLSNLAMAFDDIRFTGNLSAPMTDNGSYRFDLVADGIDLNRYMAPTDASSASSSGDQAPIEIPVDLIRPLRASGKMQISRILLGAIVLDSVDVGLNAADGKLRINPITANLFAGKYKGNIRLDVSGTEPTIAVDESISGVSLASLSQAMFEKDNITGSINGSYKLTARGADTLQMQKTLNGSMSFELLDGAWEGRDIWYELRSARARLKQETPPEPRLPARTEFSAVTATGKVTDGIFSNNDLLAELPFMRLTGNGSVDIPAATVNYSLSARVFNKPELKTGASADELADFTKAVIPLKITGPLAAPAIRVDVEALLKKEVEKKVTDELMKLLGKDKEPAAEGEQAEGEADGEQAPAEEKDPEDILKDRLRDLLKR
jgi:AsmA protein